MSIPITHLKRVGLSLLSAISSELLVVAWVAHSSFEDFYGFMIVFTIFVVPGWLLSLPAVLLFDRIDGWRFWALGLYGILTGPIVILVWGIVGHFTEGDPIYVYANFLRLALPVATLSTIFYLCALKYFTRDSMKYSTL